MLLSTTQTLSIEVLFDGSKLQTGTFHLVTVDKAMDCLDGGGSCGIGDAETGVKGKQTDPKVFKNGLRSASGTLKITEVELGEFHLGFAEGYISGTFFSAEQN